MTKSKIMVAAAITVLAALNSASAFDAKTQYASMAPADPVYDRSRYRDRHGAQCCP